MAIEAIEDWTFAYLKRVETLWGPHGYHRYPAKFIPQLVSRLIEQYSLPGALVGDPFLGSATTGIEALRLGRRFWGGDISQVALLISRAKCTLIDPSLVSDAWRQLDGCLQTVPHPGRRPLTQAEKDAITTIDIARATGEERLRYWFPSAYYASLEAILQHILRIPEETLRTFFLCGFSNILKRCSIWLSGSTKAQKDLDKMLGDPVDEFRRQMRDMLQRNILYWHDVCGRCLNPSELGQRCRIDWQDARHLALPDAIFDLVVTSPPYAICYEYKEIHQLTQLWLEHIGMLAPAHQQDTWIGSKGVAHRNMPGTPFLLSTGSVIADTALDAVSLLAVGKSKQGVHTDERALRYYFQDMYAAIGELSRVTAPGKRCVLIVGDSYRRGITIPTSAALCEMACTLGFELERKIVRQIPVRVLVSTRDKTTGRFSSTAQSDTQVYPEEHILIFRQCS
ncbi:MAG: DNA methyltransferase [Ktedonobacteraceae bacterium]